MVIFSTRKRWLLFLLRPRVTRARAVASRAPTDCVGFVSSPVRRRRRCRRRSRCVVEQTEHSRFSLCRALHRRWPEERRRRRRRCRSEQSTSGRRRGRLQRSRCRLARSLATVGGATLAPPSVAGDRAGELARAQRRMRRARWC